MKLCYTYRPILSLLVIFTAIIFISACQSSIRFATKEPTKKPLPAPSKRESSSETKFPNYDKITPQENPLIQYALSKLGTPYCYGGATDKCFDCSGFVVNVFKNAGIYLPRTAEEQFYYTKRINENELNPGDLVFFANKDKISHVGIFIGNNELIHASTSMGVIKQSLNDYYLRGKLVGFGRVSN